MVCYSLLHSHLSDRFRQRFWFFIAPIPITLAGFIMFMTCDGFGARYASFFLMIFIFAQVRSTKIIFQVTFANQA